MPGWAPRCVFRCFRALERFGDRITGAAGPFFIAFAIALLSLGVVSFFTVIAPTLAFPLLSLPLCALIAANLLMHYFYVCTVSPGFVGDVPKPPPRSRLWAQPKTRRQLTGVSWSGGGVHVTKARVSKCRRCACLRPERAHHCRVCNRCVLKYDHHCPWINQCVGLHNERHFVMFLGYLVLSTTCFVALGYPQMWIALGFGGRGEWTYFVPETLFLLISILCGVLALAVGIMFGYHLWAGVGQAETSVEAQDHEVYRRVASERGDTFTNSYDLGVRRNVALFFNVGSNGQYPWYTLVLPLRINPYTDGYHWARREGLQGHSGVREGEELTDEEMEEP